jgi:hypothetical protein
MLKGSWNNPAATTLMLTRAYRRYIPSFQEDQGPMPESHGEQIVETTTEARQGVTGHNVRYVLVWSTVGVIIAFVSIYFLFFS